MTAGVTTSSDEVVARLRGVRAERLVPVALMATVLTIAILTVTPWPVGAFQDDAIYTVLAKSLASGDGYRMLNLPGEPHATHYPPVYPALLALLWRLGPEFPDNLVVFKFANAVFLSLAALGAYQFGRTRLRWPVAGAAGVALAGTVSILVLLITGVVLSEPLFMALLWPALRLSERSGDTGDVKTAVGAGLLLGLLALVRTLGALAIPAAAVVLLWRRRPAAAAALTAAGLALLVPWQLWVNAYQHEIPPVLMGKYGAYGPWLADGYREGGLAFARGVVVTNVQALDRMLNYAFMPIQAVAPRAMAFLAVTALTFGGFFAIARRAPVTALFMLGYLAVILLWPFEPDRFVVAVWPLLLTLICASVAALWRWHPVRVPVQLVRGFALAIVGAVTAGYLAHNARGYREQWWTSAQRDAGSRAKPIAEWVTRRTSPTDVLATDDDLIVYLYTGRQAVPTSTFLARERIRPLTATEEVAVVRSLLDIYRPRFFITTSRPGIRTANALAAAVPPRLRPYGQTTNALIYERLGR